MKILYLISSNGLYGAEKVVLTLAKGIQAKGHQVIIANIGKETGQEAAIIKEAKSKEIKGIEFSCHSRVNSKTIRDIRDYLLEQKIDIVHSHGYKSNYFALKAIKGTNIKLVATCHNWTSNSLKMKFYEYVDKRILKKFNQVIAVSSQIYQKLITAKVPENQLKLIYNGIEVQDINPSIEAIKAEYHVSQDTKCIGTIGRLSPEKGQIYLIRAFKQFLGKGSKAILVIVGEGPLKENLQQEAIRLDIGNKVIFTGYRADSGNILALLDVFVLPSLKEGVPMILLEAMLANKVIVATEVGEVPKVLGTNGILCAPGDESLLASSINKALLMSIEEQTRMGEKAHNTVTKEYSQDKMVAEYEKIYQGSLI